MANDRQAGVWAIIYCPLTRAFLFGRRSRIVRNPGMWNLFGGRMEAGETPRVSLLRELSEEAGVAPPRNRLIHLSSITGVDVQEMGHSGHLQQLDYFLIIAGYEIEITLNHEHSQYRWFRKAQLPKSVNRPTAIAYQLGLIEKVEEGYS